MGLTNFPNGITSFGLIVGGGVVIPAHTGETFWVDSGDGRASDGNYGSPDDPMATIDAAVDLCVANRGDLIVVAEGHAETISAATSLVLDVAGVTIVGLGVGDNRPTLTFSATASRIPISADNVRVSGLLLVGGVADIVSGVTITGDDVEWSYNEMRSGTAILEFLQFMDIDTATRAKILGSKFVASATAGSNTGIRHDVAHYLTIEGCEFSGDWTTAAISGNVGTGAASDNVNIKGNDIENLDATAGILIDMHDDSTGRISRNDMFTLYATNITAPFDSGDCLCIENYVVNAVDETGAISPTTPSASA